jgi:paraquat-inducible protein B
MEIPVMSNENQPQAKVSSLKQMSVIWLVPVIALLIGLWMLYQNISQTGPEITLRISDASGLEVGKTEIRYLSVKVGVVTEVGLSEDYDHIEC